ncbi:hypothetical protein [Acinetobacter silvestris]|nr:hypothetical protein [Acinetobacter silvestris]
MKNISAKKYQFLLILLLCGGAHANIYTPHQTSVYIVENPNKLVYTSPDLDKIGVSQQDLAKSFQEGQELSNTINAQRQRKSLEKILAKNTLSNGDVDLVAALADARKSSNENVNIIARMIREDTYSKQQSKMQSEKIEAESRLNEAKINLQNAKNEEVLITAHLPPKMNSIAERKKEEKVYIEHISDNLYKIDDGRIIKTQYCHEYVYSEKALIINTKLIFKNGKSCDIEKIVDM